MKSPPGLGHLLIGQPDLSEAMMRALGLKGTLPQYVEPELNASLTVADLTAPEFLWLRRIVRLQQTKQIGPVAAQFSQIVFAPVAGASRSLAVLERVIISNSQAATVMNVLWDAQPNALSGFAPAAIPKSALDDRAIPFNQLQPTPSFGLIAGTAAASLLTIGGNSGWVSLPASSSFVLDINAVFTNKTVLSTPAPSYFVVEAQAVNIPLTATFIWRERALLASEAS